MKKIYHSILVAAALLTGFNATAQFTVPLYGFSQFSGTFSAISGGTVFGNSSSDDQSFVDPGNLLGTFSPATGVGIPLGFNFSFIGNTYDVIGINNNGWISLGQSSFGSSAINDDRGGQSSFGTPLGFNNSSAPIPLQAKIAGFATDLKQQPGSTLRVEILGTTPNQVAVIEFLNFRQFASPGGNIDFQIRLYETTNIIDVVYGGMTISNSTGQCQVGLRGSALVTDFNLRNANAPNSWVNSAAAPGISSTSDFVSMQPVLGQTYRWTPPPPCTSAPPTNTLVATTTLVCPAAGTSQLLLAGNYGLLGITYLWQLSTVSNVGPFTSFNGGIDPSIITPTANTTTWYRVLATCGGSVTTTLSSVEIDVAATTISNVPYQEGFEGVNSGFNELPNCSWLSTDTTHCKTSNTSNFSNRIPHTGNGYANFDFNSSSGTFGFFSNGIQLNAGVTYSSSVWFITPGFGNINSITLSYGPNQSSTGSIALDNVTSPQNSNYAALTNTFVVASSGIYYLSVTANGSFSFLAFDDLSLTAPCSFSQNVANLSISAPATLCFGETVNLTATGVNTYTWDSGSNSSLISVTPTVNTNYSVAGTNTLSGCTSTSSAQILVNPLPAVSILPSQYQVCSGSSIQLVAIGATSYTWSNGLNAPVITVTPGIINTYSVIGSNAFGCEVIISQAITVHPLPNVSVTGNTVICAGERLNLNANGANSYTWTAANLYLQSPSITPLIQESTIYTVTGINANGCSAFTSVSVIVNACTGLAAIDQTHGNVLVYPNPSNGEFTVELNNGLQKTIEVTDVTGRIVSQYTDTNDQVKCDLTSLANGIYYIKVKSGSSIVIVKVIKH